MNIIKNIKRFLSKKAKILKLLVYHSTQLSFKNSDRKRIIICFNGVVPHGGLVDRLKGIISFYEMAKLLDYEFYIQFDNPFNLDRFLQANKVNWKINKQDIKWHPIKTKLLYLVNDFDCNPIQVIKKSNAKTFLVYANIDYLQKIHSQEDHINLEQRWRVNFRALFKKSQLLNDKLKGIESDKFISFHTRFTSLMGDFKDTTSIILNDQEKQAIILELQHIIKKIKTNTKHKCYAFSDSIFFLEAIKSKENITLVEGNPFHMDNYERERKLEGHLKTLIDFFMISKSETVYFLKVGKMYHSSFSKYAAIIGNKPFKMISS